MPNIRRRRFSVQNEILQNIQKISQSSQHPDIILCEVDPDVKEMARSLVDLKRAKQKIKANPMDLTNNINSEPRSQNQIAISKQPIKEDSPITTEKDATSNSKNIGLCQITEITNDVQSYSTDIKANGSITVRPDKNSHARDRKRDKYPLQQHCIKVRTSRIRMPISHRKHDNKHNIGVNTLNSDSEAESTNNEVETAKEEARFSTHSIGDMCRICHGGANLSPEAGTLISACSCRGSVGRVHVKCLERWLMESGKSRCELCGAKYSICRIHRYGLIRAIFMWILSQNSKQLLVDILGIILMSPLGILAGWLLGKTLAGLTSEDKHSTPWPLASTFVLACMTLVCYYCWIVSAVSRHALAWWIWYRSQYEVKLQVQNYVG